MRPGVRQAMASGRTTLSALMLWALWFGPAVAAGGQWLEVRSVEDELLLRVPMPEGDRWCLGWNHSVRHFPVLDCYRHHQGRMELERSHQPDFAAGLGHSQGRGEQVSDGKGGYWIENIHEPVPGNRYVLRVGSPEVDHRLVWQRDGETNRISLSDIAAGQRVTIQLNMLDN
ncbi:hypothetical protein LOKO_03613 [Halomonas chromatireducens]|uniref:DUF1850 domain-containing protein n=2 Tax=Halomonas chromatireducens TaxID=507626 RepID=A0A120JVU7_9GAMM|nr:hypothetical protein LOKO_01239 [Halomonas chromatireducens]AMD02653.1 hypothetical protein LOKO_03613 [Halomonas chromatireducens]